MEHLKFKFSVLLALFGFGVLLFSQCTPGRGGGIYMQQSGGKINEIILVVNTSVSPNVVADTVKTFFTQSDVRLPQAEALYDVLTIPQRDLNTQAAIMRHHNIVVVNINDTIKKEGVSIRKDVWAAPQLVVHFEAKSDTAFYRIFNAYKKAILEKLDQNELLRARFLTDLGKNVGLSNDILEQFDLKMSIPAGFYIAKKTDDFMWFYQRSHQKHKEMTASVMIWKRPYTAELQFSTDSLIRERNRVGRLYIPGPTQGSFMRTATSYIYPHTEIVSDYATKFAVEMRGLWELEGDFMGGPFISYTFAHPKTNQLITIDAFLYHPNHDKRPLLRQLQAVITNVTIPE